MASVIVIVGVLVYVGFWLADARRRGRGVTD
jgi:hypothetical protein